MTRLTLDQSTLEKLRNVDDLAEIYDERGIRIGVFSPDPPRGPDGKIIIPFSDEEILGAMDEPVGRPLRDILADLEGRG